MEINTRDFGAIQVDADAIYEFSEGLYGFEEDKEFAVFPKVFDDVSLLYLQSTKNATPCFLVFEPWDLHPGYDPILSAEDLDRCGAKTVDDLIFLVIATVRETVEELTINVKSPIVLNPKTKKAMQVILQNPDYSVRYRPFQKTEEANSSC
ncbi:MAG: flagellar assembly protein FliW [Eubacteriales bacterium]|jgi:flagellar assembly factor FliW|nr:flagellar assembly protein FliW [Eubacteriales bacterium]MDD3290306.1 flagellar assembly protein FliW [Eubacteriales bacterium]MDD3863256.1 flagellar assembly protein FliW [Eubacteriales bacterium]MDD4444707.1 flagellar assembly protein FliW [Eubacteriales bacterium]